MDRRRPRTVPVGSGKLRAVHPADPFETNASRDKRDVWPCAAEDRAEGSIRLARLSRDLRRTKHANSSLCDGSDDFAGTMADQVDKARFQVEEKGRDTDVERQVKQHGTWRLLQEAKREGKYVGLALVLLLLGSAVSFVLPGIAASTIDLMLGAENEMEGQEGVLEVQKRINGTSEAPGDGGTCISFDNCESKS